MVIRRLLLALSGLCVVVEALSGIELCPLRTTLLDMAKVDGMTCHAVWCSCKDVVKSWSFGTREY